MLRKFFFGLVKVLLIIGLLWKPHSTAKATKVFHNTTIQNPPIEEKEVEVTVPRMFVMEVTAYNATVEQCGKADGITASGRPAIEGRTVACNDFPLGTRLLIGNHEYVVEDRAGVNGIVDVYFESYDSAIQFGRKVMEVTVVE